MPYKFDIECTIRNENRDYLQDIKTKNLNFKFKLWKFWNLNNLIKYFGQQYLIYDSVSEFSKIIEINLEINLPISFDSHYCFDHNLTKTIFLFLIFT